MLCTLDSMKHLPMCQRGQTNFGPSSGKFSQECSTQLDTCPPGHEMKQCQGNKGRLCQQCSDMTFQPNHNSAADRCRLKTVCQASLHMTYKEYGSPTTDAVCKCLPAYHFVSKDHLACYPNNKCDKGYGQTDYGSCQKCIDINSYSDLADTTQRCKPLRNCEKDQRCTIRLSDGTFDNVCGSKQKDVSKCENATAPGMSGLHSGALSTGALVGITVAAVTVIFLLLLLLLCCYLRRRRRAQLKESTLTESQFETLKDRILERCGEDSAYCKKVMTTSFYEIENKINRQKWSLAQELFRGHHQGTMYEIIVEKYKDKDCKYAVNGYLRDWRETKGDNKSSVQQLFNSLKNVEREDILYQICNKFRPKDGNSGYPEVVVDAEAQLENGIVKKRQSKSNSGFTSLLFPCCTSGKKRKQQYNKRLDHTDTKDKLLPQPEVPYAKEGEQEMCPKEKEAMLNQHDAGAIYRERPSPSAPVIDESGNVHMVPAFDRQASVPVQVSS